MCYLSCSPFSGKKPWLAIAILSFATSSPLFAAQAVPMSSQKGSAPERKVLERPMDDLKGDILMARGEYAAAIGAYQAINSRSAIVWNKIGMAYHHLFALDEARTAYLKALAMNPRYAPAANNLAAVYYAQGNLGQAEHFYKRALKYTSEDATIYCNLGTAYFAEKKYNKGKKEYRKAFSLDHQVFTPDEAALVQAASSREQRIALNYYLAQTYAEAGEQEQALNFLRKAMDEGFNDRKRLSEDKEFAELRATPKFHELLVQENLN
jgi:tetratricopeptide (TPR) repeat protein